MLPCAINLQCYANSRKIAQGKGTDVHQPQKKPKVWAILGFLFACLEVLRLSRLVAGGMYSVDVKALGCNAESSAPTRQQSRAWQVEATVCTPASHSLNVLQ